MIRFLKICIAFVIITGMYYSCSSNICNTQMNSYLRVSFYNRLTNADSSVPYVICYALSSLHFHDSIITAPTDSTLLLPLSNLQDSAAFYIGIDSISIIADTIKTVLTRVDSVVHYDTTIYYVRKDTLIAYYKRKQSFVSYECGFLPEYTLRSIRLIGKLPKDSVVLSDTSVSNNNLTNCKIFFMPKVHSIGFKSRTSK